MRKHVIELGHALFLWLEFLSKIVTKQFPFDCLQNKTKQNAVKKLHEIIFNKTKNLIWFLFKVHANLVICGLFICDFAYLRLIIILFSRTYPLICSHPWSLYMRFHYMRAYFLGPYLSHITRSACNVKHYYSIVIKYSFSFVFVKK